MQRRRVAWLTSLTLMAVGGALAHALAYRLVAPTAVEAHGHSAAEIHGYLPHLRICLAICGAVALVALAAALFSRVRAQAVAAPLWLFALFPPVGFAVQEHLERLFTTGAFPIAAALEPTFLVGLVLQIPFALAAYLAARALIALAVAVARRLLADPRRCPQRCAPAPRPAVRIALLRASVLALGHGQRGPPLPAAS